MKTKMLLIATSLLLIVTTMIAQNEMRAENEKLGNLKKANGPVADFDKTTFDFGELIQNSPGTALFQLTNNGNEPLVISNAKASCGCTNLTYSKDPILPGKNITISATYNAAVLGGFTKTITVTTNASEQPVVLQIKGKVVEKKK
jgi:hypothetical protein